MKILLDTNFLIDLVRYKVDIDFVNDIASGRLAVVEPVLEELKKISGSQLKERGFAEVALILLKKKNVEVLKSKKTNADEAIFSIATKNVVATNDIQLRKRLRILGVKTIYLRAKKHLAMG